MLDMFQFPALHNHHCCLVPSYDWFGPDGGQSRPSNMADEAIDGLPRSPMSLYKQCVAAYVASLNCNVDTLERVNYLQLLPPIVLADIYVKISKSCKLEKMLLTQLVNLDIIARLLRFSSARQKLFHCIATLGRPLAMQLHYNYIMKYFPSSSRREAITYETVGSDVIDFGLRLSSFLSEAGWVQESIKILTAMSKSFDKSLQDESTLIVYLDCMQRLLHSEAIYYSFKSAERTYNTILAIMDKLTLERIPNNLLTNIYTRFSVLFFLRSEYDHSQKWSILALKQLKTNTPEKIIIDVLRQAAKSCVVKREFKRAHILINQAVKRARLTFGKRHQKYADALLDYGFFLLNVDSVSESVNVYNDALKIKQYLFGQKNLHVAISHEDISYAYYVHEYSSGNFRQAREHVENAIYIMKDLVPPNHLMLASAKRVKALLLEEIAIDKMVSNEGNEHKLLLGEAELLHRSALTLSLQAFGEINVQTAKHYGNLGRLYQSMMRFEEAEEMHKKAIKIKTDLLGPYDYEVGLSIGHLASLYNYHMKKYREAEELYLRSIEISLRLFGKTYSGLEYDYSGLCHIYQSLNDVEKHLHYVRILENWQALRERSNVSKSIYPEMWDDSTTLEEVTQKFFEMCSDTNISGSPTTASSVSVVAAPSSSNPVLLQA